ncbi:MAG TPA: formylmethanofuran dehydrogenase subunit A, partial [Rhizobiaceae bacterium]|nr:formylmethanofuran dehydrogenase subunit A [Rhizobiaceae bacterium]
MLTKIAGGEIIDPMTGRHGVGDLWMEDGVIVEPPSGREAGTVVDASGCIVMAGAIDIHSHIGGGNVNTARLLLPEHHSAHLPRPSETPLSNLGWTAYQTGRLYAQMGFTTVVEPAMAPGNALHTHLELADIPIIDKATLAILGNDDFLLSLIRDNASSSMIEDYVAWTVASSRALGVKVINAGGSAAFKENMRRFSLDDEVPSYGVSSRKIVKTLQAAVQGLGIPHPLHVHCNNLGMPGSADTAAATIAAAEGVPLHLAHLQFYGYGTEGRRRFSSAASQLAEQVNSTPEITIDVGQVMFGQTVTISSDVLRQFSARGNAHPKKSVIFDGDGNGGGIVPYRYSKDFYGSLQWAIGLELFLLITDPWRVFFTTDHPNGAPFTAYPALFELLMSREARREMAEGLSASALALTTLPSIDREYTLEEIAIMTRAAPAKLLGLKDRGNLRAGAIADVAVYRKGGNIAEMFGSAAFVFKDGELVVKDGDV